MAAGDYLWGVTNLNDGINVITLEASPPAVPVELLSLPTGRIEGDAFADTRFTDRIIPVKLHVFGATAALAEAALDNLIGQLYRGAQNLTLGYQDERYWPARLQSVNTIKLNRIRYELDCFFKTFSAFGYSKSALSAPSTAAWTSLGGGNYSRLMQPAPGGSIYTRPTITITFPAGGGSPFGVTQIYIENQSLSPAPRMTINYTFAASDVLVIDCQALTVKVDGVEIDYSGQFLTLDPRVAATNDLYFQAVASSTPTLNISVDWRSRFAS